MEDKYSNVMIEGGLLSITIALLTSELVADASVESSGHQHQLRIVLSTINTRVSPWLSTACLAAAATLFSKQKPLGISSSAWWPGGRTTHTPEPPVIIHLQFGNGPAAQCLPFAFSSAELSASPWQLRLKAADNNANIINTFAAAGRQRRGVTTWSPLATAFNTRPNSRPIFDSLRERTGLFNKPELTSFEGFNILKEQAISATDRLIDEATSGPSRPMVEIFDELSDTLCKVADLAEFVRIAHPQSHFASAAEDACISVSGVVEKLNTHKGLYEALRDSVKRGTSGDQHLAELFLFDFEQSGIQLEDKRRRKVVGLNNLILQTGQRFMAGAARPRRVPRDAVPQNVRQFTEGDDIIVSGVYAECGDAAAREAAYRLAIKASTMETAANVRQFLDVLSDNLYDRAKIDFDAMLKMKKKETPYQEDLACWDTPYFTHKAKTQLLNVANSDFSPYFSLGGCMEGLNMLCQELYGISLKSEEMLPAVVQEQEGLLGHIYCDLYERPGKPHQDCHFTIQGGKLLPDGSYQW
ncbi:hypothetical protein MSG28_011241 [Choristoneura fumiferana]|uniref:Uncharacterized protein n=1 Tax=Choristoneura fumiferana TaxID=7141 RepID=A0ACC0KR03_CHOFU|nr:hypothetical protein MSG28_011241 [Choristoneura fumiferana]